MNTKKILSGLGYKPSLDGLRALAIILVVLSHANFKYFQNGGIGVSIFFTLSGFLITTLLLDEFDVKDKISFKTFYVRRAFRLFPALYVMLLAVAIYTCFFWTGQDQKNIFYDLLSSALYLYNISWSWGWGAKNYLVYHTWSLGVEEQFYLFWPFILVLFLKLKKKVALINYLILFILLVWISKGFNNFNYVAGSIVKESIFMGCLLALLRNTQKIPEKIPGIFPIISLILLIYLGVFPNKYLNQINETFLPNIVGIATSFLIIYLLNENALSSFFSNKYMVFIGKISYSLYIWHLPVFKMFYYHSTLPSIVSFILKFAVTLILSLLSWYLVEKAARDFGRKICEKS